MIKKYEKKLTKEEEKQRKFKDRKIIKAYDVGFEGTKELLEVEIEENYYDEYEICYFSDDKIKKIKTKKTKIKNNEKIKLTARIQKCGEYIIYGRNVNKLIIIEAILGIFLLLSGIGFAYSNIPEFRETVEDFLIEKVKVDTPTAPVITGGSLEWSKERIIKIKRDAKSASGIKYYEYCISENEKLKNCNWQKTYTKNVVVSETGKFYIAFRGVSNDKSIGKKSNTEEVLIDNIAPKINDIKITNNELISIDILATDTHSGINKYYYSINDSEYKETDKSFKLENKLEIGVYKLKIKVEDKVGNFSELELYIDEKGNILNREDINKNNEENIENSEINVTDGKEIKNSATDDTKDEEKKNEQEELEKIKAPVINLNKVPKIIKIKEEYELPSYYEFDKLGGEVSCMVDDNTKVENTKEIELGSHTITCEAKGNNGITTKVTKEVEVTTKENMTWDGWMTLTLYYPEKSTDWEYRIADENEVRAKENSWKEYTAPILVRLSQVDNVYIRYKINGETYIISPKGKVVVDIEPQSYTVGENQSTKVEITYEKDAKIKEYRIDGGDWKNYEKAFNVKGNTLVEARAIKEEKVYDNEGNYKYTQKRQGTDSVFIEKKESVIVPGETTPGGSITTPGSSTNPEIDNIPGGLTTSKPSHPTEYLEGPIITNKQENEVIEETEIEITPKEKASKIYYSIEYGKYEEYKEPLKIKENKMLRAYYIRESDGKISDTTYYYVRNIKLPSSPYIRIDVEPSRYLDTIVTEATVSLTGQNYEKLEYSFDGNIWYSYIMPLSIKESKTIYARAIDENKNVAETNTTITTIKPPKIYDNYDVSIHSNPDQKNVQGLINKAEISISYDKRATGKYYKIGYYGDLKEYTGPFTLESNEIIYAYATSENGNGEANLNVNYLTTGISAPVINLNTSEPTNSVKVSIDYAKTAEEKKYKINNGEWLDYTSEITVDENCVIYAKNTDILGNTNITSRRIKNIAYIPNYTLIDKGNYYIIHLNYPDSSENETREYKWTKSGEWKKYNKELGILLIKQEGKNIISKDGVKITNEKGKEIIYTDHYYLIGDITDNLMENLYMRWNTGKPKKPTFTLSEEEPTKELSVIINYDSSSKEKLYKIVRPNKEDSGWLEYKEEIKIKENGTIIYAKGQNSAEVWSDTSNIKITNIDDEAPEIIARGEFIKPRQRVTVQLVATDNLGVDKVGYKKGNADCSLATYIENMQTFIAEENGLYTICAKDKVGNTKKETIEIKNIDKTAPDIAINILTKDYGNKLEFEVDYKDSKTKQYKLGNGEYKNYTGKVTIKSEEVLNLKNEDGSLTIYAKGIDEAGNEKEVEETTYLIDLDAPNLPVIKSGSLYPILKQNELIYDDYYYVEYDKRDDIKNYISFDNGKTWESYIGPGHFHKGTIKVKSVKKDSGLTVITEKDMSLPTDALGENAYDDHEDTVEKIEKGIKKILIDESLKKKELNINGNAYIAGANQELSIEFYDENDTLLEKYPITSSSKETIELTDSYTIPLASKYLVFRSNDNLSTYFEIKELVISKKETIQGDSILSILQNKKLETGYYNFEVADEVYGVHLYSYDESQVISETTQYGDIKDIGKSNSYAKNMVIVKVNGDLTINEGVTVGPYYTAYGGPKGFTLYVTGKLTNNGTIDNSHGAKAEGQNVYLWKNADGTYEYVPKEGGSGGAGNPGAGGYFRGSNGTGGLLIIYANELSNNGRYTSVGANGGYGYASAGSSGGGSINIFTNQTTRIDNFDVKVDERYTEMLGNYSIIGGVMNRSTEGYRGGAGGTGTISIGEFRSGNYCNLKECIEIDKKAYKDSLTYKGESILKILENPKLKSGKYYFSVNDEEYRLNLYVLDGNQNFTENQTFGEADDVGTANSYAKNMVIVKVNGDLTINEGVTVGPYYTAYGGPKGFTLYVTGKLTNNGTIDNSHGAKAEGQNVYLWKNADGTYEYVSKEGGTGGAKVGPKKNGLAGVSGTGRQTGGGGSGACYNSSYYSGSGAAGTSYSGGSGGSSNVDSSIAGNGSPNGGAGGNPGGSIGGGGAGNPGGSGYRRGANGTGGLLLIYANDYENNGILSANGYNGGAALGAGGSSGGGSINIFYKNIENAGTAIANGGIRVVSDRSGGAGGKGTITYTSIETENLSTVNPIPITTTTEEVIPPTYSINSLSTGEKEIEVTYPQGYTNEYSVDGGKTWSLYTDKIKIADNLTIFARSIDSNNKVISSSSIKITGIVKENNQQDENANDQSVKIEDNIKIETQEEIKLDIPDEILVGENYELPTSGNGICKINNEIIKSTNELNSGNYEVKCYNNEELVITKNIIIKEKE